MRNAASFLSGLTASYQPITWQLVASPPPHKIFLWDYHGTYLACDFPNPVHGHLIGGPRLQGKRIQDVLPQSEAHTLLTAIRFSINNHQPTAVRIHFFKNHLDFITLIRLISMHDYAVGWVNDYPMVPLPSNGLDTSQQSPTHIPTFLTPMEWKVLQLLMTNEGTVAIALVLGITERTVKFHIGNLLDKFLLNTRSQIKDLATLIFSSLPPAIGPLPTRDSLSPRASLANP